MFFSRKTTESKKDLPKFACADLFFDYFMSLEGTRDFSFRLAVESLEALETTVQSDEELLEYLLEDSIYTSIYATFYEQLFVTIKAHPDLAIQLIDKFAECEEDRERVIATQTDAHFRFIMDMGHCPGCTCCDNHKDVQDLLPYWKSADMDFFINLYVGMQTIQFAFEQTLYDFMPNNLTVIDGINSAEILAFRKKIFAYSEKKLS